MLPIGLMMDVSAGALAAGSGALKAAAGLADGNTAPAKKFVGELDDILRSTLGLEVGAQLNEPTVKPELAAVDLPVPVQADPPAFQNSNPFPVISGLNTSVSDGADEALAAIGDILTPRPPVNGDDDKVKAGTISRALGLEPGDAVKENAASSLTSGLGSDAGAMRPDPRGPGDTSSVFGVSQRVNSTKSGAVLSGLADSPVNMNLKGESPLEAALTQPVPVTERKWQAELPDAFRAVGMPATRVVAESLVPDQAASQTEQVMPGNGRAVSQDPMARQNGHEGPRTGLIVQKNSQVATPNEEVVLRNVLAVPQNEPANVQMAKVSANGAPPLESSIQAPVQPKQSGAVSPPMSAVGEATGVQKALSSGNITGVQTPTEAASTAQSTTQGVVAANALVSRNVAVEGPTKAATEQVASVSAEEISDLEPPFIRTAMKDGAIQKTPLAGQPVNNVPGPISTIKKAVTGHAEIASQAAQPTVTKLSVEEIPADEVEFKVDAGDLRVGSEAASTVRGGDMHGATRTESLQTPNQAQSSQVATQVAVEIARNLKNAQTRFQMRFDPPELGRVEVNMKVASDGSVQAHLIVERPETLDMFMRDQRALERALETAGLNTNSNDLQFSLKQEGGQQSASGEDQTNHGSEAGKTTNGTEEDAGDFVSEDVLRLTLAQQRGGLDLKI